MAKRQMKEQSGKIEDHVNLLRDHKVFYLKLPNINGVMNKFHPKYYGPFITIKEIEESPIVKRYYQNHFEKVEKICIDLVDEDNVYVLVVDCAEVSDVVFKIEFYTEKVYNDYLRNYQIALNTLLSALSEFESIAMMSDVESKKDPLVEEYLNTVLEEDNDIALSNVSPLERSLLNIGKSFF
jgi:hypothetical protein